MSQENNEQTRMQKYVRDTLGQDAAEACMSEIPGTECIGDNNRNIKEWIDNPKDFVYIWGEQGTGKTYYSAAIFLYTYHKFPFKRIWKQKDLLSRIKQEISNGIDSSYLLRQLTDDHLIIIDDFACEIQCTDYKVDLLQDFVEERYASRLPTVFTSNYSPQEIKEKYDDKGRIYGRIADKRNIIIKKSDYNYRENKDWMKKHHH